MRTHPPADRTLAAAISRSEVFLVRQDGRVVGTLTLDDYADPEFWTPDDDPGSALYVHRMIVTREAPGQDLGGAMLDWAAKQAARTGRAWLCLDAWRTNLALHRYYERHGFVRVRTVVLPHRGLRRALPTASTRAAAELTSYGSSGPLRGPDAGRFVETEAKSGATARW
jgi:GNAT superfamily N-acetyltransferase